MPMHTSSDEDLEPVLWSMFCRWLSMVLVDRYNSEAICLLPWPLANNCKISFSRRVKLGGVNSVLVSVFVSKQ